MFEIQLQLPIWVFVLLGIFSLVSALLLTLFGVMLIWQARGETGNWIAILIGAWIIIIAAFFFGFLALLSEGQRVS